MRLLLILLLALAVPFNAAYAAGAGLCDALESRTMHGGHLGHHAHTHEAHETTHAPDEAPGNDLPQPGSDHHPAHIHPVVLWVLSAPLMHTFPPARTILPAPPASRFTSAILPGPDRPPRHAAVA